MDTTLAKLYKQLRAILKKYEPPFIAKKDTDAAYELWTGRDAEIAGRKRDDMYFAGLVIQSNYVGFYYMPVYTKPAMKKIFKKELLSTLKGKSCFHIKNLDAQLTKQLQDALEAGYKLYKQNKWI